MWETGTVSKWEPFSLYKKAHWKLTIALFDTFYFAKDFDTFYKVRFVVDHLSSNMNMITMPFLRYWRQGGTR
jgi:ABC-type uncharacterized transport system substrate-binding protein